MEMKNKVDSSMALKIAILALVLVVCIGFICIGLVLKRTSQMSNILEPVAINVDIQKEAAKLIKRPPVKKTAITAQDLINTINRRDYTAAKKITDDILAADHIDHGQSQFGGLISSVYETQDKMFEQHLNEWVEKD